MILLSPDLIAADSRMTDAIDEDIKSIYRLLVFSRQHHAVDLLTRYREAVQHLRTVLSIKNAQQEAQTEEEAAEYLTHLKACMDLMIEEVSLQRSVASPVDLFRLFRAIDPDAARRHPNGFRQTLVQFGPFMAPAPGEIPGLVEQLFSVLPGIRHPVLRAVYLHHELVRIHPFVDGNGRVSRMAKNWLLMYELYPPVFIYGLSDHRRYIGALQDSFTGLEREPGRPNPHTVRFFEDEIRRIKASTGFILNRMKNNPQITFGDDDFDTRPYRLHD